MFVHARPIRLAALALAVLFGAADLAAAASARPARFTRKYNGSYAGDRLTRVAFPLGGIGAGMVCLEGTGALSHLSVRHAPEVFNEPCVFAALAVKGASPVARILEGPVPAWKIFGNPGTGNGAAGKSYGLPRLANPSFTARFPFGRIKFADRALPVGVQIEGWSPFIPGDADNSSLPAAALEYRFTNNGGADAECVFSFNARNFIAAGKDSHGIRAVPGGFVLWEEGSADKPADKTEFSFTVSDDQAKVNCVWFRGGWWDPLTMAWNDIAAGACYERAPIDRGAPGATIFVPFTLGAHKTKTIEVRLAWYTGASGLRLGKDPETAEDAPKTTHVPWYAGKFANVDAVADYWRANYRELRRKSRAFSDTFYDSSLPPEVIEAVAANLTILKSPTVLRQADGRLWCFEGCSDSRGCCYGSCTHVWNYAQALPHLFPALERTLRETEFEVSQNAEGHQVFRTSLPIRPTVHDFHAAADGQLGGIMKVHREWRVSGDSAWLARLWPKVKASLDYCQRTWDPDELGFLREPHHNTSDIEFWGPDGMCTSFYLGALKAAVAMGTALGDDVSRYASLLRKGAAYMESELFNGEYFIQKIEWENLRAGSPLDVPMFHAGYSPEALELLKKEGPKYQYGAGCLSDGVLGAWIAAMCGIDAFLDAGKVAAHLDAVHRHNLKRDLAAHANPQRPSFACGGEGGLLLCTWPKGGKLSLPFVYSDEVWTGIEYQVASHLMLMGAVEKGLDIVRVCRDRYDGRVRNPFNEYECGHWYARALASYGLLQGLTGARYDAVDKIFYLAPSIKGDFHSFFACATGYGTVGVKDGKPFLRVKSGVIDVKEMRYAPKA